MSDYPSPVFKQLTVNGGATVRNGLTVPTGVADFQAGATVEGGATVNGGLTVASGTTALGALTVSAGAAISGGATVNGGLTVASGATALGATTIPTMTTGDNSSNAASTAFVNAEITNNAPGAMAALAFGAIGTYACAKGPDNTAPGATVAGNTLTVFNSNNATSTTPFGAGTTWRYMGSSAFSAQGELWLRIS